MTSKILKPRYIPLIYLIISVILIINCQTIYGSTDLFDEIELYYLIGLTDLTVGVTHLQGYIEPITDEDEFATKVFIEGRFAVYLKGKVKGKYLVTAQLDTGEGPLSEFRSILKRQDLTVNPDQYYPIYGDDSTIQNDVKTSGKLYLSVEWDNYKILWGDYASDFNTTVLTAYNRQLYGVKLDLNDHNSGIKYFWSIPGTIHSIDKIKSTGSSIYYLKYANILSGSDRLKIEVQDRAIGEIIKTISLQLGRDYTIDYLQGRVILLRALEDLTGNSNIINNSITLDNDIFLIAEYEHIPEEIATDSTYGFRAYSCKEFLNLGGNLISEKTQNGELYTLYGADMTYAPPGDQVYFKTEWAYSVNQPDQINYSDSGGLSYIALPVIGGEKGSNAVNVNFNFQLPTNVTDLSNLSLSGDLSYKERGFVSSTQQSLNEQGLAKIKLQGNLLDFLVNNNIVLKRASGGEDIDFAAITLSGDYSPQMSLSSSLRYQKIMEKDLAPLEDTIIGLRIDYTESSAEKYYLIEQFTLNNNQHTPVNHRVIVGMDAAILDQLRLKSDVSAGSLGDFARLNLKYYYTDQGYLYGEFHKEKDAFGGVTNRFFTGNNLEWNQQLTFLLERQSSWGTYADVSTNLIGLEYLPTDNWLLGLEYTSGNFDKKQERPYDRYSTIKIEEVTKKLFEDLEIEEIGVYERDSIGIKSALNLADLNYHCYLQASLINGDDNLVQYLVRNRLNWDLNPQLALITELDGSLTMDPSLADEWARGIEGNLGFAYRPITDDSLNLFGKFTYLENLSPAEQISGTVPDERSAIATLEGVYDLIANLQLSEKLAYKSSALRSDDTEEWITSDTYLWINRLNYAILAGWGVYGEYRRLWNTLAQDSKQGYLIGMDWDIAPHTQLGIGYNFTDFNDDLTNLNYESQGLFMNVMQKW